MLQSSSTGFSSFTFLIILGGRHEKSLLEAEIIKPPYVNNLQVREDTLTPHEEQEGEGLEAPFYR